MDVLAANDLKQVDRAKERIEELVYKEAKGVKETNMDIEGIHQVINSFDTILDSIYELETGKPIQKHQEWNDIMFSPSRQEELDSRKEEDSEITKYIYEQKIAKLEVDLKREKELRQVKYYRSDKKTDEIKKLSKEKDDLANR